MIVTGRRGVRGTVTLATRLNPDKRVDERGAGVGRGAQTETSADGVAPVTPSLLTSRLLTRATLVDDELGVPALCLEKRGQSLDEVLLIVVGVA